MLKRFDQFLNAITMYRLVLWSLSVLASCALLLGFAGKLPYTGGQLFGSVALLILCSIGFNKIFAVVKKTAINAESSIITGLILFFILSPASNLKEAGMLVIAAAAAMVSKYFLGFHGRHIFNPAAFGAFALGLAGSGASSWWVATAPMLIPTAIVGLAVVRKVRRFTMFFTFLLASLAAIAAAAVSYGVFEPRALIEAFVSWPLIFFGSVMLTEPLTAPPTLRLRLGYGLLAGALMTAPFHIGRIFSSPELVLLIVNMLSFLVSQKRRLILRLAARSLLAPGVHEFSFTPDTPFHFQPGQYLEWTLPHASADSRGIRRYFTIASSPTEGDVKLGVRISAHPSTFKKALVKFVQGDTMTACHCAGDFILPKEAGKKIGFIAGGIGITPFRSMIKFLLDTGQKRDVVLCYACAAPDGFCYGELFDQAQKEIGLKYIPIVTDTAKAQDWIGRKGMIDEQMLKEEVPDFRERIWFLSGPSAMVDAYKKLLRSLGISRRAIVTDYFPGF